MVSEPSDTEAGAMLLIEKKNQSHPIFSSPHTQNRERAWALGEIVDSLLQH
jgi:hypothetical protein